LAKIHVEITIATRIVIIAEPNGNAIPISAGPSSGLIPDEATIPAVALPICQIPID